MNTYTCPSCDGKKTITVPHNWSDGWGMVHQTCPLCGGKGELDKSLQALVIEWKEKAAQAMHELEQLKTHVALYKSIVETGNTPQPPLLNASRPSPYKETWAKYLDKAIKDLPRTEQ